MQRKIWLPLGTLIFSACASTPISPEWTRQSTRQVDNGYIVYLGKGEASNPERAQFKAEGQALEDLANECSMIPIGTRIEDRYGEKDKHTSTAYVKVALEFQECEAARRALEPSDIKKIANVPFTQQLKRYQDLNETGDLPDRGQVAAIVPPSEPSPLPAGDGAWSPTTRFFVQRQYVVYQKQIVVLAPPTAYAPGSVEAQKFVANVQPAAQQVVQSEVKDPTLRKGSWSGVPEHPHDLRPATLSPKLVAAKPINEHAPAVTKPQRSNHPGHVGRGKKQKRPHKAGVRKTE